MNRVSAAYYVAFDRPVPIDTAMDGKALAANMSTLSTFCLEAGVHPLELFVRLPPELARQMMDEIGLADVPLAPEEWFEPAAGVAVLAALIPYVDQNADFVTQPAALLEDLQRLQTILAAAQGTDARWRLEIDI